ncbi:hypothetical protein JT06_16240 [Desulfobulbus sp. Tol-SR]|nr:hypothetical protein JT06_16240 [Desulfobulbus sp. Tol-SR]
MAACVKFGRQIDKPAGEEQRRSNDQPVSRESMTMLRSVYRGCTMVVQACVLGAVCSLLASMVMAQEPVGKAGDP